MLFTTASDWVRESQNLILGTTTTPLMMHSVSYNSLRRWSAQNIFISQSALSCFSLENDFSCDLLTYFTDSIGHLGYIFLEHEKIFGSLCYAVTLRRSCLHSFYSWVLARLNVVFEAFAAVCCGSLLTNLFTLQNVFLWEIMDNVTLFAQSRIFSYVSAHLHTLFTQKAKMCMTQSPDGSYVFKKARASFTKPLYSQEAVWSWKVLDYTIVHVSKI